MSKYKLTQSLIEQFDADHKPDLDQALQTWWKTPPDHSGLRLTLEGVAAFKLLNIEYYEFSVPPSLPVLPSHLLTLDRKLTCPYYIKTGKTPSIVLYGSKEATMMAMYGDLEKWMRFLNRQ